MRSEKSAVRSAKAKGKKPEEAIDAGETPDKKVTSPNKKQTQDNATISPCFDHR